MESLFKTNFNWGIFLLLCFIIFILFPSLSLYSYFALVISIHQLFLLFYSINYVLPIRYLFGTLMCLQMFIGPVLAYNGLDKYQYYMYIMRVPEALYFSYTIPAVIGFILGLHIASGKLKGEFIDESKIRYFLYKNKDLPFWFIGIGFVSSLTAYLFSADFAFVFYLLGNFKYIGVFLLVLGGKQVKLFPLILVFSSVVFSSLGEGMFHDLLTWFIMIGAVLALKFKPNIKLKFITCILFIIFTVIIQQVKGSYRESTRQGMEAGLETFQMAYETGKENNTLFSFKSLSENSIRINQGFIITNIMQTVPSRVPYANGDEFWLIVQAAVLPRILAPDKLNAGDRELFTKYSGLNIKRGTSMGLSSVGDAYINFGIFGGCIFMFLLGLLYNGVLKGFYTYSKNFPLLLLFVPIVFYYPIRPDCELQTILGHLVKSCFLIFVIFIIWKRQFRVQPVES